MEGLSSDEAMALVRSIGRWEKTATGISATLAPDVVVTVDKRIDQSSQVSRVLLIMSDEIEMFEFHSDRGGILEDLMEKAAISILEAERKIQAEAHSAALAKVRGLIDHEAAARNR